MREPTEFRPRRERVCCCSGLTMRGPEVIARVMGCTGVIGVVVAVVVMLRGSSVGDAPGRDSFGHGSKISVFRFAVRLSSMHACIITIAWV